METSALEEAGDKVVLQKAQLAQYKKLKTIANSECSTVDRDLQRCNAELAGLQTVKDGILLNEEIFRKSISQKSEKLEEFREKKSSLALKLHENKFN